MGRNRPKFLRLFYKKIIENAEKYLKDKGMMFLEIGYNQAERVVEILKEKGYQDIKTIKDYSNNNRVLTSYFRKGGMI